MVMQFFENIQIDVRFMIFLHIDMVWGFSIFIVCASNVASTLEKENTNLEDGEQIASVPSITEIEPSSPHGEGQCHCKDFLGTCIHNIEVGRTMKEARRGLFIYYALRNISCYSNFD